MSDFLLDKTTKDLDLSSFDIKLTTEEDGQSLEQRLEIKLSFFLEEWFLNTNFGIPYFQKILGQKISKSGVDKILKDQILATPDVDSIEEFVSSLDKSRRSYAVTSLRVKGSTGEIAEINSLSIQV